ncbi:MAG: hypothetical protein ABH827_01480 [bacterium]
MKVRGRAFLIFFMSLIMLYPCSYGIKKIEIPFGKTPVRPPVIKDLGFSKQSSLLEIKKAPKKLSQNDIIELQHEINSVLLLLDYGWQVFNSDPSCVRVKHLSEILKLDVMQSFCPFLDVEEALRGLVLELVHNLKLTEKVLCQKPEKMVTINEFYCWISGYVPFIIYFLEFCFNAVSGAFFHDRPKVFDEEDPDYIDIKEIIQIFEEHVQLYCRLCSESVFHQRNNSLLSRSVPIERVFEDGKQVIEQIKLRHKKVCELAFEEVDEEEPEVVGHVLHRVNALDLGEADLEEANTGDDDFLMG